MNLLAWYQAVPCINNRARRSKATHYEESFIVIAANSGETLGFATPLLANLLPPQRSTQIA